MRVTFVLPQAGVAGGVRVVAIYAERLKRRGHEVTVVSVPRRLRRRDRLRATALRLVGRGAERRPSHLDGADVDHHVLETHRPVEDRDVPDADVVIATWWETAEWVARLSARKGAKAYFIQHHEVFPGQPVERVEATWRLPFHKITIARWLVDVARERYGDTQVSLVENSVDTDRFNAPPRGKQARPSIGYLYARIPIKGHDVAMRTAAVLARRFPDLRVVCYGVERPTAEAPIPPGAEFTQLPGPEQLARVYASVDVWLVPSRGEGFHLPPLEAMACRTPVVATRVGGAVETVTPGVNGYLAEVEDHEGLAEGARKVLELSEAGWRSFSDAALARARAYTWEDATTLLEAALRTAVDRAARGEIAGQPALSEVA